MHLRQRRAKISYCSHDRTSLRLLYPGISPATPITVSKNQVDSPPKFSNQIPRSYHQIESSHPRPSSPCNRRILALRSSTEESPTGPLCTQTPRSPTKSGRRSPRGCKSRACRSWRSRWLPTTTRRRSVQTRTREFTFSCLCQIYAAEEKAETADEIQAQRHDREQATRVPKAFYQRRFLSSPRFLSPQPSHRR
jgi:hypothetical protein